MNYFEKALAIRKIKKEQSLIDSTEAAIEATLLKITESLLQNKKIGDIENLRGSSQEKLAFIGR